MNWSETSIAGALATQFFNRKYLVVVPNCNWTGHECDLLVVTNDLRIIDVEIKISRADLKADAKKEKWWNREFLGYGEPNEVLNDSGRLIRIEQQMLYDSTPRTHPRKIWKHYYAMPAAIWTDDLLDALPSSSSGVLLLDRDSKGRLTISAKRRATPCRDAEKIEAAQAVDIARLASLRMWATLKKQEAA
ncbi:hypothetical protein JOS77_28180 [Chromobacterium haemolyticum]|nr:hypothetical protein JOS77_28180 [Chromobacterium haemolyticum]